MVVVEGRWLSDCSTSWEKESGVKTQRGMGRGLPEAFIHRVLPLMLPSCYPSAFWEAPYTLHAATELLNAKMWRAWPTHQLCILIVVLSYQRASCKRRAKEWSPSSFLQWRSQDTRLAAHTTCRLSQTRVVSPWPTTIITPSGTYL